MKFLKTFWIALFAVVLFSCNQKPSQSEADENVKYYRHIQFSETSWDVESGIHPLTAKEAESINNYKFTYNENKQLIGVEYNRNGVLLDYSSMGASKITYTYEGSKQLKNFFNDKGEATKSGGAQTFEYTVDNSGMRVAMCFLDENGEPTENRNKIYNYKWKKLADGMIQELRYNMAGEEVVMNPFCPFYELRFSYDEKGYLVRMANYDDDTLYNCTEENCGDIGVSYFLFENTKDGDVVNFSVHNTGGQLSNLYGGWAKRANVIDENGYVLETAQFDQDNEYLGGKRLPITASVYDEHGAMVKKITMDKDKNISNNPDNGVAIVEYKYDEEGRRIETVEYDKDGAVVEKKG